MKMAASGTMCRLRSSTVGGRARAFPRSWSRASPKGVSPRAPMLPSAVTRLPNGAVAPPPCDAPARRRLTEKRWSLPPLGTRDAAQADMSEHAFKFGPLAGDAGDDADAVALIDGSVTDGL